IASFLSMISFVILAKIHLLYLPSPFDTTQDAYNLLLSNTPRLLFASLITFSIVQKLDFFLFNRLKTNAPNLSFSLRNLLCLLLFQTLDTLLFSFLGLWGLVFSIRDIIWVSLAIKLLIIGISSPLIAFFQKFIQPAREPS
ncbi:MAG: queuosine precursor transporter, partial [Chlamydiales bacterium]|nr:queuosine precursor transporter [Chlamydiales bacterium]